MTSPTLASFTATDGTGLWEVTSAGIRVNGELYRFTDRSFVVCAVTPGRTERSTNLIEEEDDGLGDLAALDVLQETGSLTDAALARWALGGSSVRVETDQAGRFAEVPSSPLAVCSVRASATAPCATARTVGGYKPVRFGPLAMRLTRRLTRIARDGVGSDRKVSWANGGLIVQEPCYTREPRR